MVRWALGESCGVVVAGGRGAGEALDQLHSPHGLALDSHGALLIADNCNHRVLRWSPGAFCGELVAGGRGEGTDASQLSAPRCVVVTADGAVLVSEGGNARVTRWKPGATKGCVVAGGCGEGACLSQLYAPTGLALDSEGGLFIADSGNHRVVRWLPGAASGELIAGGHGRGECLDQLDTPAGLVLELDGALLIADSGNGRVVRWVPGRLQGEVVAGGRDELGCPWSLALAPAPLEPEAHIAESDRHQARMDSSPASRTSTRRLGRAAECVGKPRRTPSVDALDVVAVGEAAHGRPRKAPGRAAEGVPKPDQKSRAYGSARPLQAPPVPRAGGIGPPVARKSLTRMASAPVVERASDILSSIGSSPSCASIGSGPCRASLASKKALCSPTGSCKAKGASGQVGTVRKKQPVPRQTALPIDSDSVLEKEIVTGETFFCLSELLSMSSMEDGLPCFGVQPRNSWSAAKARAASKEHSDFQDFDRDALIAALIEARRRESALVAELGRREAEHCRREAWARASPLPPWPSQHSNFEVLSLTEGDAMFGFFAELLCESCVPHRRDLHSREFRPAPQLCVTRVDIVRNPRLAKFYHAKAEELEGLRSAGCDSILTLTALKIPAQRDVGCAGPDLNEHFLFHGAPTETIGEICQNGFDPRRAGEGSGRLFGMATYLAPNASKSDLYTDASARRLGRRAPRQVVIARALLGASHRTAVPMRDASRPPDGADGRPLDSVWADVRENGGAVDHVEVMVYDKGQAYPQAVVTYVHMESCPCAECEKRRS